MGLICALEQLAQRDGVHHAPVIQMFTDVSPKASMERIGWRGGSSALFSRTGHQASAWHNWPGGGHLVCTNHKTGQKELSC